MKRLTVQAQELLKEYYNHTKIVCFQAAVLDVKEKTDDEESSSGKKEDVADNQQNDQLNDAL